MPPAIQIRDARESDGDILLGLHKALYQSHRDAVVAERDLPLIAYRDYERVLTDDLRSLTADRAAYVLVAESDGVPVGYITGRIRVEAQRVLPRRGVVEDWYVEGSARGAGIGKRLLEELERRFIAAGCELVESATWTGNQSARRAHESLGFREIRVIYRKRL